MLLGRSRSHRNGASAKLFSQHNRCLIYVFLWFLFLQIFETFGSVQQPFYSLRFPASALPDPAIFTPGRAVFYSPKMATFVFTRDIRGMKGSDASNIFDEEVGAAEMEWSDDEAEQDYKRSQKAQSVLSLSSFEYYKS